MRLSTADIKEQDTSSDEVKNESGDKHPYCRDYLQLEVLRCLLSAEVVSIYRSITIRLNL